MSALSLDSKLVCVFGLRGTGKSVWVNRLATGYKKKALVFDTLGEIAGKTPYDFYAPVARDEVDELCQIIDFTRQKGYKLLVIDEANRYAEPKPKPLPPCLRDLVDYSRHWKLTVCWVARRPIQVHSDIIELSDYLVLFRLTGRLDRTYLDSLATGLGEAVFTLPDWHYILVNPDRSFKRYQPVQPVKLS